jgi:hypothetical protein
METLMEPILQRLKVRDFLALFHNVGPFGHALLAKVGIADSRHVGTIGSRQRAELARRSGQHWSPNGSRPRHPTQRAHLRIMACTRSERRARTPRRGSC